MRIETILRTVGLMAATAFAMLYWAGSYFQPVYDERDACRNALAKVQQETKTALCDDTSAKSELERLKDIELERKILTQYFFDQKARLRALREGKPEDTYVQPTSVPLRPEGPKFLDKEAPHVGH